VDQTQRGYDGEEPDKSSNEDGRDSFKDDDNVLKAHSLGTDNHASDGLEFPPKCFDLRQARAMFMPHKVPKNDGIESVDSQEELRNLTGNEIWELTQKAAKIDHQKTAQLRQVNAE
jgi:hypothetical protein